MSIRSHVLADANAAAEAGARHIAARLEQALAAQPHATIALSGGRSPRPLFEALARAPFPWREVHFFWADERAVPPTDAQSNYKAAAEAFLIPAGVPQANIHRVHGEMMPASAARAYADEIARFFGLDGGELPQFDVVHLGLGPDAHTASLFPGLPLTEDREGIAAAVQSEKLSPARVTLLPGVLAAARNIVFLVTGPDKAEAVRATFQEPFNPARYPAQIPTRQGREVDWFLDVAAARLLAAD